MKSKTYNQSKQPLDKNQGSKFCQSGVKQANSQNLKKKGSDFFLSQEHVKKTLPVGYQNWTCILLHMYTELARLDIQL